MQTNVTRTSVTQQLILRSFPKWSAKHAIPYLFSNDFLSIYRTGDATFEYHLEKPWETKANDKKSLTSYQYYIVNVPVSCYVGTRLLSINQSYFYNANVPGEARFSGATAKSVFNSKIEETIP